MVKLVLVESPSKCETIKKYLGTGYNVLATFGHFRTLNTLSDISIIGQRIDIAFSVINTSKTRHVVERLRDAIHSSDEVILATDDDREGEAIAWHVCDYFSLPLETTRRITFHEITPEVIRDAIDVVGYVDMNKVHAQFARQLLDIFIGFKISPLLWKYISNKGEKNCISAGRCQTPALKLIHDNYDAIQSQYSINEASVTSHDVKGYFTKINIPCILNGVLQEDQITEFMETSKIHEHIYSSTKLPNRSSPPPVPLNTASIIQQSYNCLHISPRDTMKICQRLYENGFITYMRTDNTKYSSHFVDNVSRYLARNSSEPRLRGDIHRIMEHTKSAHEAIRPTKIHVTDLSGKLDAVSNKLYKLIWKNSIASCLEPAIYEVRKVSVSAPLGKHYEYIAERSVCIGWTKYSARASDDLAASIYEYIQNVDNNTVVHFNKIETTPHVSHQVSRYSESQLVNTLEKEGIGRPSTYAMILGKLQNKHYVTIQDVPGKEHSGIEYTLVNNTCTSRPNTVTVGAEKRKLVIQNTGIAVSQFLYSHFGDLFDIGYTRQTELELDDISCGNTDWMSVCIRNYNHICGLVEGVKKSKIDRFGIPIDESHTYILAKYGPVIKRTEADGAVSFLKVREDINIDDIKTGEYSLTDILKPAVEVTPSSLTGLFGKYNDIDVVIKTGKYGRFVIWGELIKSIKCFGNKPIGEITMEEMAVVLNKPKRIITKGRYKNTHK
jgi:DNA topoisomerase-1